MLRRLSTRLVLTVLGAVILPFLGFALFIGTEIDTRLKENVVQKSLLGLASALADELDREVRERNGDVRLLASEMVGDLAISELEREPDGAELWGPGPMARWVAAPDPVDPWPEGSLWRRTMTEALERFARIRSGYDLVVLVSDEGELVACNGGDALGGVWDRSTLESLFGRDWSHQPWFDRALAGSLVRVDHHRSPLIPLRTDADPAHTPEDDSDLEPAAGYHIGFAAPVPRLLGDEAAGVLFALVNWRIIQERVDVPQIKAYFSGLVRDKEPSPYAWIWSSDADTILAHEDRSLYGERVSGPVVGLPSMVEDARSAPSGLYREYTFQGERKNAAFQHCRGPEAGDLDGGLGWVVGVGINNEDIFAMGEELRLLLYQATAAVVLLVVLWIMVVARRTTRPILALQQHTRRVAEGDLDVPSIQVHTAIELEHLAADFNEMVRELREKQSQLIKAEKDAAWREMARQIAHDIKNPLTPIQLAMDLIHRARAEGAPEYEAIQERSLQLIANQIANLREIATDFYEFTGGREPRREVVLLGPLLADVLDDDRVWIEEIGVQVEGADELRGSRLCVSADRLKLRRVLSNLVANALQAMPEGGRLVVSLRADGADAVLELRDTGVGLSEEVRAHLFEPYFTTRSEGTGLGLAIAKRVLEELGGSIALEPAPDGSGTVARVVLPVAERG